MRSSSSDAARLIRAMSSSPTPASESTTIRTVCRRPAAADVERVQLETGGGDERFQHAAQLVPGPRSAGARTSAVRTCAARAGVERGGDIVGIS